MLLRDTRVSHWFMLAADGSVVRTFTVGVLKHTHTHTHTHTYTDTPLDCKTVW